MNTLATVWAPTYGAGPYGQMDGHMWWGAGWGWLWLAATLILLVLAGLVVWAVVRSARQPSSAPPSSRARAILDERYARGELSTEEYRERVQVIEEDRPSER